MLQALFGNETAARTLLYLQSQGDGYARGIATTWDMPVSMVQKQLIRLERDGVLVSQLKGRTRMFQWNPRFALRAELSALLEKALLLQSTQQKAQLTSERRRPRRTGKAL